MKRVFKYEGRSAKIQEGKMKRVFKYEGRSAKIQPKMPCYSCSSEFGFLKKEVGCDVCGFSFCSRCCKKREISTKEGPSKKLACNNCFEKLNGGQAKTAKLSPPLAHKKRMAAMRNKSYSVDSGSNVPILPSQWSCEKDQEIADRLKRLKEDRVQDVLPSEEDIAERLAKLKGIDPSKYKAPPIEVYRCTDRRTSLEQASDLMKQFTMELELDSRLVKPEDEIAERLARLRDEDPNKYKDSEKPLHKIDFSNLKTEQIPEGMDIDQAHVSLQGEHKSLSDAASKEVSSLINDPEYQAIMKNLGKDKASSKDSEDKIENDDDEEEANKLVEKLLASDIDVEELESLNDDDDSNSKSEKETEEFPWCVICTEDAKIRCFDCDSDIYCQRCFKECHDSLEIKDHKTCPYLQTKSPAK